MSSPRHLPWAQHLGAIDADQQRSTAMQRTAHHLAATPGDDTDHHTQARRLLARRDQLTDRYRATTQRTIRRDTDQHRDQSRDSGLEL